MELVDVASFFDRVPARQPGVGTVLFYCQLLAYDESKRDAFTAYRRIMSTHPDVAIPSGRVVELHGTTWLVGGGQADGWATPHRKKYVLHQAAGQAQVHRLSAWLVSTPDSTVWADVQWVKDAKELEVSSKAVQRYVAVFPSSADVREYDVVTLGEKTLLVTSAVQAASGYLEATGNHQETSLATVMVSQRTFNPATGGYSAGVSTAVSAMKVRWQELYAYENQMAERYQEGDCTWVLPVTTAVTTATELIHGGDRYTVLAIRPVAGCKAVHARLK